MRPNLLLTLVLLCGVPGLAEEKPESPPVAKPDAEAAEATKTDADAPKESAEKVELVTIGDGPYRFTVDTTQAPDLEEWTKESLIPVIKEWYPKIVEMLPGKDYKAPETFRIKFDTSYKGVAATMGTLVVCDPTWYRRELKREALGSVVHELVHVVQQYGRQRVPGWLTEGVADYIRWYLYEPESKGCEIKPDAAERVRHNQSYRVSANFLNWVVSAHDKELIPELNAALREGRYAPDFWNQRTRKDLETLAADWKKFLADPKESE